MSAARQVFLIMKIATDEVWMVIAEQSIGIIGGIDTHKDTHTVAAVTTTGQLLVTAQFTTDPSGYRHLLAWLRTFGPVVRIGVEGTGSYGAGLTRYLRGEAISLVEVIRPKRQWRRRRGKSDPTDAEAAARAALSGEANGTPKDQDGLIEATRLLRLARRSALLARTQAVNQLQSIVETAPANLREQLRRHRLPDLVAVAKRFRVSKVDSPAAAARLAFRSLSIRWQALDAQVTLLDTQIEQSSWCATQLRNSARYGASDPAPRRPSWSRPGTIPSGSPAKPRSRHSVASVPLTLHLAAIIGIG
jgi:transposase